MFYFKRITLFCLKKRLPKHNMTILSKNLGRGYGPPAPPGYAYGCADFASTFALDVQQLFLHSFKEKMALRPFLGIYSSFVQFRSSLR